jgi:galactose mutarotase-like enzyme
LFPGEQFSDYYLAFEQAESLSRYLLEGGLQNGQTEPVLENEKIMPLRYELFENDAIVLKGMASEKILLRTANHNHGLDFEFAGYPYFGIWTKEKGATFICLEPWHGIAGSVDEKGELTQKEGIIALPESQEFTCSYTIRVY